MRIRRAPAALTALLLLLAAALAAEPPGAPQPPAAPAPAAPAAATRLTVEDCLLIAIRNNVDLRRGRLADRQAELDRSSALAEFLPSLSASATRVIDRDTQGPDTTSDTGAVSVTQTTPLGTTITARATQERDRAPGDIGHSSGVSAEVRQPLLAGAGPASALYGFRAADLTRAASAGDLQRQAQSTVFLVRRLYWAALQDDLSLAANRRSLESADYFLKASQARLDAGQASRLDVSNAEIQRSTREVALNLAEARLARSLDGIKEALDLPFAEPLALTSAASYQPAARDAEKLLRALLARRPDLVAARRRVEILRLDLERKRRNSWPSLDLVAGYSLSGSGGTIDDSHDYNQRATTVSVELSVPLGLLAARNARERADLELRRGELDLHRRQVSAELELRNVLRDLGAAERNSASYEKRLEAARLSAAAARALYERGKSSSFDVVRAEDDLLAAELGLAASRADALSRAAELDFVTGRPVAELLPPAPPAPPAGAGGPPARKGRAK